LSASDRSQINIGYGKWRGKQNVARSSQDAQINIQHLDSDSDEPGAAQ
jgi:hypothetical protein